jgi:nicotinate-nucleotide--dimethylbenzimidazole phosphoribosyltransferase
MSDTGHVPTGGLPPAGEQATHVPFGADGSQPQGAVRPPYTFVDLPDGLDEEEDELLMPGPQSSWSEPVQREPVAPVAPVAPVTPVAPVLPLQAGPVQAAPLHAAPLQVAPLQAVSEGGPVQAQQQPTAGQTLPLTIVPELVEQQLTAAQPPGEPIAPSWPPITPPPVPAQALDPQPVPQSAAQSAAQQQVQPVPPVAAQPVPAQPVAQEQAVAAPRRPLHAGPPIPDPSLMTGQVPVRSLAERGPSSHGDAVPSASPVAVAQHPGPEYLDHPAAAEASATVQAPAAEPVPTVPAQQASPASTLGGQLTAPTPAPAAPAPAPESGPVLVVAPVPAQQQAYAPVQPVQEQTPQLAPQQEQAPEPSPAAPVEPRPPLAAEPAAAEPPVAEVPPVEVQPLAPVAVAEPVSPPQNVAPVGGGSRISAFMAAPAPQATLAVDPVEAAVQQPAAAVVPEPEPEPVREPTPEPAAVTPEPAPLPEPATDATALGSGLLTGALPPPEGEPEPAAPQEPEPEPLAAEAPAPVEAGVEVGVEPELEVEPEAEAQVEVEAGGEPEAATEPEPEPEAAAVVEDEGHAAPGYEDEMRDAVHRVMRERRDIRNGFRSDPVPHEVLLRVLEAAHTAPSVGYSQPWDFVVIRSAKTRARMHELAERQRDVYAESLPKARAKQFKELKIEAILETPVNIVVTADRTRGGRHTLGRHTQPQMAPYSAALAVENLWLAARAEGLGVGWVSFFDEHELVSELGLPEHLDVVAYLCVGYVNEFPSEPELAQAGWAKKRPLSWVVHEETYGRRALPGEEPRSLLQETLRGIRPLDAKALGEAWDRQKRMTKPAGSLGMLEIISAQLCGLSRKCPPPIPEPACVAVFAGDHGVHAQGVTHWPQEVTAQMVANFLAGGAVVNAFASQLGAEVCVVDVGVAAELPPAVESGRTTGLLPRKVRPGTDDMTVGPAMSREDALRAVEVGIETARDLVAAGNKALVTGDMGIANTTPAAALICVFTGEDPSVVTGRGTGINDETHARKVAVIRQALELHRPDPADPIGVLAAVGGFEHAAIAGFLLGAASLRTPVILDGVIAGAAALVAKAIAPEVLAACIAGHRSAEPGHKAALAKLGLRPLIDLDLRLGEGTGALLALPLVQSAARAMHDVATFDSAGVTEKQ